MRQRLLCEAGELMKDYEVLLKSPVSTSFRCQKAADSLDINTEEKSIHHLKISADIDSDYSIGLIIGASGSGKTTLAKQIYGDSVFSFLFDYKMEYARKMLETGQHNVNEVGLKVGYSTSSHFIAAFKKKYGTTPKKYLMGLAS